MRQHNLDIRPTGENLEEGHALANWGIHLSDSLKDYQLLSYNYNSKGLLYLKQNLLDSSLTYLALSNSAAEKSNDHAVIAYNKSIMGDIFFRKGDVQTALRLFTAAATESGELNLREVVKNSYYGLSQCYARLKNFERAYHYHMLYDELNSTLLNWETTQKALITELEFAEEKKEQKIAELELANKKARQEKFIYIILSAVFVLFMLTITALVIRNNRQRIQSNKLLQEKNYEIAQQNEKLKQSNTVKDKLFSIISHDLRTPLASLKGLLAMALRKDISDAEFRGIIPKLNNLVIGTNETLENLFLWSHSQMNGWSFQPGNINLKQLTERCLSLFSESAKTKSINLESKIQSDVYALADENQLELILRNLLNNALKFTQQGGQITLEAEVENDTVEVRITDTGIGMEAQQLQTLFDKKNTQTTRGTMGEKGTGLGLQLCKEMVEINSGTIAAESIPGKGSTFKVKLKAVKPGSNLV